MSKNTNGILCIRICLIIFNTLAFLVGVVTLGIGIWLFYQAGKSNEIMTDMTQTELPEESQDFLSFSIFLVVLGGLITIISFLGCFGALIDSRYILMIYLISVSLVLSFQLLISIVAIMYREPMGNTIRQELFENIQSARDRNSYSASTWDMVQQNFKCCGIDGFSDWFTLPEEGNSVPDSCCIEPTEGCGKTDPTLWHKQGCLQHIHTWTMEQLHLLGFGIISIVFLQLFGIIASTVLYCHQPPLNGRNPRPYAYERAGI